MGLGVRMML